MDAQDTTGNGPPTGHPEGRPDVPADPQRAQEPVLRRPFDPDDDPVHDMGGNVGLAPMTDAGDHSDASADPGSGAASARSLGSIASPEPDSPVAASGMDLDDPYATAEGDSSPAPVPVTNEYVDIDAPGSAAGGPGADGDTGARLRQHKAEVGHAAGSSDRAASERAAETPAHADAERMESALREGGPFLSAEESTERGNQRTRPPEVEEGPGTSLT